MSGKQRGLQGWTRSFWWKSNIKRNFTNNGTRVGFPRKNIETLSKCVGKPKLIWSWVEASNMNVKKKYFFFAVRVIKQLNMFLRRVGMCPSLGNSKAQLDIIMINLLYLTLLWAEDLLRDLFQTPWFCDSVIVFTSLFLSSIFDQ